MTGRSRPHVSSYNLSNLAQLEHEAVFVMREVAAQFERPVLMFSGGKDSIVMVRLAQKAFWPARMPFPLLHIDTGHNFPEALEFRDELVTRTGVRLIVRRVEDSIKAGRAVEERGANPSRNALQTVTLLDAVGEFRFDAALGGARRDEEKARAKERFFSHRDEFGQWDPKNQRPELWNLFNGRRHAGRAFPRVPALATGPSWTSGNTSRGSSFRFRRSISRTRARSSTAAACCWRSRRTSRCSTASAMSRGACASAPWAT